MLEGITTGDRDDEFRLYYPKIIRENHALENIDRLVESHFNKDFLEKYYKNIRSIKLEKSEPLEEDKKRNPKAQVYVVLGRYFNSIRSNLIFINYQPIELKYYLTYHFALVARGTANPRDPFSYDADLTASVTKEFHDYIALYIRQLRSKSLSELLV